MLSWWKSLSIATRLHVLIQGALVVILLSLQGIINVLLEKDVLAQARARTAVSADGVINGMNMLMETGMISIPDNRALLIRKMGASENVRELRIIRAKQVQDQFGPGLPEEQARDDMDREAIRTARPQFQLLRDNSDHLMRAVVPFVVSTNFRGTNCLRCHHVQVRSVNGAASITVDLSEDFQFLGKINKILWSTQAGLQLLLFAVIGVMTRSITRPLQRLQQAMENIVADKVWKGWKPVEPRDSRDEVGRLTESFNRMGAALHEKVRQLNAAHLAQDQHLIELREGFEERKRINEELDRHRHRLQELVQERTKQLTDLYNSAPCGYHSVNADRLIVNMNDTELQWLGYTREEVVGRMRMDQIVARTSREAYEAAFLRFLEAGHVEDFEVDFVRKDGTQLPILLHSTAVYDDAGTFLHSNTTVIDNTERKRREERIRVLNDELARRAAEAESATRAKSAFLANMGHEIRTPLNAIAGMAYLLKRDGVTREQAERLDQINHAAAHLLGIINGVLDLSKIEAGKLVLESKKIALDRVVGDVCAMLSEQARAKGLALGIEIEPLKDRLKGDATRLQQALLNYVSNAIKFTERGTITVRVHAIEQMRESVLVRFEVQDSGVGIRKDVLTRLFGAFEQADSSTTRRFGGTGLGLAITQRLVQLMGGEVGATSTPGVGSLFWFTARLAKVEPDREHAPSAPTTSAVEVLRREYRGTRLLVVEDEPINRLLAKEFLADAGCEVDTAENGVEAVERVENNRYALILMDMQMPKMDGLEATRRIRTLPNGRSVPIVAMTANAFAEDREACLAASMNDFVTKPFVPETLYQTILRWLSEVRGNHWDGCLACADPSSGGGVLDDQQVPDPMYRAKSLFTRLAGGDRRSVGRSDLVVQQVLADPSLFGQVIEGLSSGDVLVRVRCADVAEKISRTHLDWLQPHTETLLTLAVQTVDREVRWHIAQMLPRLTLKADERRKVMRLLLTYLDDRNRIVSTFALRALVDLADKDAELKDRLVPTLQEVAHAGRPALRARARRLAERLLE
jgi:PAS domain S-box-containing protein